MPTIQNSYHTNRKNNAGLPVVYDPLQAGYGYIPNYTIPGTPSAGGAASSAAQGAANSGLGGWFKRAQEWGSKAAPNAKASFKNLFSNTGAMPFGLSMAPEGFDWSAKSGAKLFGKNVGKAVPWVSGAISGLEALQGLSDYSNVQADNDKLQSNIIASSMGNPLLSSYLTSDQLKLLGDVRDGRYNDNAGLDDFILGAGKGLGNAILPTVLGAVAGGIPGAIVGGAGSLINSGIDNLSETSGQNTAELQALYQALQDAEMQYKAMKRPNFTGLGIQQRYQDMYA